jgi:hypothetical protein
MFRTCWDIYIKFYTVFMTFSIAAMGFVISQPKFVHIIALVFIGESLLCATTSAYMSIYTRSVEQDQRCLEKAMLGSAPSMPAIDKSRAIPVALATWAGWANAAGMIGLVFAWFYLAHKA